MRYKVVILPIDCEEEWEPDRELQTGLECDSVFMITFVNGKASDGIGMHINVDELKDKQPEQIFAAIVSATLSMGTSATEQAKKAAV